MTAQKDRTTVKLSEIGAAWAVTSDKCILPNDSLEDQINQVETYHIHPDQSEPRVEDIQRFTSINELEDWIREQRPPRRRERRVKGKRRNVTLPQGWVNELKKRDGSLQAAIERLVREELAK